MGCIHTCITHIYINYIHTFLSFSFLPAPSVLFAKKTKQNMVTDKVRRKIIFIFSTGVWTLPTPSFRGRCTLGASFPTVLQSKAFISDWLLVRVHAFCCDGAVMRWGRCLPIYEARLDGGVRLSALGKGQQERKCSFATGGEQQRSGFPLGSSSPAQLASGLPSRTA